MCAWQGALGSRPAATPRFRTDAVACSVDRLRLHHLDSQFPPPGWLAGASGRPRVVICAIRTDARRHRLHYVLNDIATNRFDRTILCSYFPYGSEK